jgi:hypothetical protein
MKTLRELLDDVEELDKVNALASQAARAASDELEAAKSLLQNAMVEQGTDIVRKDGFTVTNVDKERPQVVDWDAFYPYVKRSGNMQLFERRISSKAYAEIIESRKGKEIPGVIPFQYQQLQIRRG